jgi:hypothetical protein
MPKQMDHAAYQKAMKRKSVPELQFIIRDAGEAAAINPEGENNGYYLDEVSYAAAELRRRQAA